MKWTRKFHNFRNNFCDMNLNLSVIPLLIIDRRKILLFMQIFQNCGAIKEFENRNRIQRKKKLCEVTKLVLCSKKIILS